MIMATAMNGVIGNSKLNGKMPWYIREELKFFRNETLGKAVVMGRKTAEDVGLLDRRLCISMSASGKGVPGYTQMRYSEVMALSMIREVMICGGAEIYNLFMNDAARLVISELNIDAIGDIYAPKFDRSKWITDKTEEFNSFTVIRRSKNEL